MQPKAKLKLFTFFFNTCDLKIESIKIEKQLSRVASLFTIIILTTTSHLRFYVENINQNLNVTLKLNLSILYYLKENFI